MCFTADYTRFLSRKKVILLNENKQWECQKQIPFELKEYNEEEGIFTGYAAVFNVVDDGGDIIEPGAFTKTIAERGPTGKDRIKILALHNDKWLPIGKPLELYEDSYGLFVKGKISNTTMGNDVKTLLKDKVLTELSIGYDAIKSIYDKEGRRILKELRLYEFSPITWAMNSAAAVTGYKAKGGQNVHEIAQKMYSFDAILTMREIDDMRWKMQYALNEAIECVLKEEIDKDEKLKIIDKYLIQYHAACLKLYDKALKSQMEEESMIYSILGKAQDLIDYEVKAGRKISKENEKRIKDAITALESMLKMPDDEPKEDEEAKKAIENMLKEFKQLTKGGNE